MVSVQDAAGQQSSEAGQDGPVLWAGASASAVWSRELDPLANLDLLVHELGSHRGAFLPGADSPQHDSPGGNGGTGSVARSAALDSGSTRGSDTPASPSQAPTLGQATLEALAGQQIRRSGGVAPDNQNQNDPPPPPRTGKPCSRDGSGLMHSKTVPTDGTAVYTNSNKPLYADTVYTLVAHGTFTTQYPPADVACDEGRRVL
jgi:hypothetical protein